MPMAVMCFKEELNQWAPGSHTGTFRGNTMSMVAGTASMKYMLETELWKQAREKGHRFREGLRDMISRHPSVADVRGRGCMIGVELVDPTSKLDANGVHAEHGDLALTVQQEAFKRGLIMERGGRHGCVIRFLPPAIITDAQIDRSCEIFEDALLAAEMQHGLK